MRNQLKQARETRERKRQQARRFVMGVLAALALSAVFLVWSTWQQSRRKRATRVLQSAGAVLQYQSPCPEWFFDLFGKTAADAFFPKRVTAISTEAGEDAGKPIPSLLTDESLQNLSWFTRVERVDLRGSHVTDEGLDDLARLKRLKHLDLRDTGVTDEGVERLRRELPDTEIER